MEIERAAFHPPPDGGESDPHICIDPGGHHHESNHGIQRLSSNNDGPIYPPVGGKEVKADKALDPSTGEPPKKLRKPWGLKWRSSTWFITTVVAVGVCTDALTYQIIVPVLPYRLEQQGYTGIAAKVSWLTFAYSIGIFISTFPVAYYFAKYPYRRMPLVIATMVLIGAQILFMLVKPYPALVVSRLLMGMASTVIWTVGFALICENVDEAQIGRQIGYAISGVSIGTTIAPPIGGALYWHISWYAPFVFCLIMCFVDLVARLLVIERKTLLKYQDLNTTPPDASAQEEGTVGVPSADPEKARGRDTGTPDDPLRDRSASRSRNRNKTPYIPDKVKSDLSPWRVCVELCKCSKGLNGFLMTIVFGFAMGMLDPTLTLRIQNVWHKNSDFVGLVYLCSSAPTFVTGPLIGAGSDKFGPEWFMAPFLILAAPWLALMNLSNSLPGFIVYFALAETFLAASFGPVGLELALAAREVPGLSEIHQFAAMNLGFSISTAIGSVVGGQMYDHLTEGWAAVCWFSFAFVVISIPVPLRIAGRITLWIRIKRWIGKSSKETDGYPATAEEAQALEINTGNQPPPQEGVEMTPHSAKATKNQITRMPSRTPSFAPDGLST